MAEDAPPTEPTPADPAEGAVTTPPIVAIVGRPNVGKSTLFNAFARSRIAIVEDLPGVTRDRIGVVCEVADRTVELVDTGGVGMVDAQGLDDHVDDQIGSAIEDATAIIFVVDARAGIQPLDTTVAQRLRRHRGRVVLVANKVESERIGWDAAEFERLGFGSPILISAKERLKLFHLEDALEALLPDTSHLATREADPDLQLAMVGRVNAGKSTFVNALLEDDRMIVSEVAGTTRDSVDLRFDRAGRTITVIDTAGIRKELAVQNSVDFYAQRRAEKAMRRADVTALVIDASIDVGRLDRKIADYALTHYHPVLIVANKWDLAPRGVKKRAFLEYLDKTLPGLDHAPVVFTSALNGQNLDRVLEVAFELREQAQLRVSTAKVNQILDEAYARRKPRPKQGRIGRIYYGSQVDVEPPTFVLFINERYLFPPDYLRYLENRFREHTAMKEVPIRIFLKERDRSPSKNLR